MNPKLTYIVEPSSRRVICIGKDCAFDASKKMLSVFEPTKDIDEDEAKILSQVYPALMNDSYKGIASCDPEDEFSVEEGKAVARRKMLKNYTSAKVRAMERMLKILSHWANELDAEKDYYKFRVAIANGDIDPEDDKEVTDYLENSCFNF